MSLHGFDRPTQRTVLRTTGVLAGLGLYGTANAGDGSFGGSETLPSGTSPRPGPPVLHDDPVTAPQFEIVSCGSPRGQHTSHVINTNSCVPQLFSLAHRSKLPCNLHIFGPFRS